MSRELRSYIWLRDFGSAVVAFCHWCKCKLRFAEATVDHEPARCEGGKETQAVIACRECNARRAVGQGQRAQQRRRARLKKFPLRTNWF